MLATLVVNKLRGTLISRTSRSFTGGKAIAEDLGIKLENHKIDDMGKAKIAANGGGRDRPVQGRPLPTALA